MILYRLTGRAEEWEGCGMLMIDPLIDASLTNIRKHAKKVVKQYERDKLKYDLRLQKLVVAVPDKALLIRIFTEDNPQSLVQNTENLIHFTNIDLSVDKP
jgi:hypothetical protein